MNVIQYMVYILCGFFIVFTLLTLLGISAGPATILFYPLLLGGLILFLVAPALALLVPRIAALVALIATVLITPSALWSLGNDDSAGAVFCGVPAIIVSGIATYRLMTNRTQPLTVTSYSSRKWLRVFFAVWPLFLVLYWALVQLI